MLHLQKCLSVDFDSILSCGSVLTAVEFNFDLYLSNIVPVLLNSHFISFLKNKVSL